MAERKCIIQAAYDRMGEQDREVFRWLIKSDYSGGEVAQVLRASTNEPIDHMAVDHFRRKLRAGKAEL